MSYFPRYDRGDWNAICDVCGRMYKASQLRLRWDNLRVDEDCWEPRQPQDFVRGVADYQAPNWTRPESSNNFLPTTYLYDPYGDPVITPVTANSTVSLILQLKKTYTQLLSFLSTSVVTLVRSSKFRKKPVNGTAINRTTLG